jgi:dihydrodipicolinate synthase/N-acetylneuraminate lyase
MNTNPSPQIGGVLPVFQTPYHEDETIDFDTLTKHIDWIYDAGADGIVMAMVSEILRLSTGEREQLAEHATRLGGSRGYVIISVSAESAHLAEHYAKHAAAHGAAAVMAIPPFTAALAETELRKYFERIINAVAIPVIIQDASAYVGRSMSIEFQADLHRCYGSRIMFKPEAVPIGARLSHLRAATGGAARAFEGSGGMALVDSYRRGVIGTMPGGEIPWAVVALWRALQAGDEARMYGISLPLMAIVSLQTSLDAFLAIEKYLLVKQGVFRNDSVRGPVGFHLDEQTRREVDRLFDRLKIAVGKM